MHPIIPYCGLPPRPATLFARWNLDPILIAALLVPYISYNFCSAKHFACSKKPLFKVALHIGWLILSLTLISPICALSVSLFSARITQHVILTMVAAPLLAAGLKGLYEANFEASFLHRSGWQASPLQSAVCFWVVLWFWHAPVPYQMTFANAGVYWTMHVTMIGSAVWLWSSLLDAASDRSMRILLAALISTVQMGFLGALISFAPYPLYTPHLLTTAAWGLSPLEDQQLGGVIMWVPGCLILLTFSLITLYTILARSRSIVEPARLMVIPAIPF